MSETVKLIADFGIMVVICAVFLYVVIRVANIYLKRLESKYLDNSKQEHDQLIDTRIRVGERIQDLISEHLEKSKSNRIHVVEFSNSVTSIAHLPFRYMTCTYEAYDLGLAANGHQIDKLSTSLFIPFFAALQRNDYSIFNIDDEDTEMGGAMRDLMHAQGEHLALCVPLYSQNTSKMIGYIQLTGNTEFSNNDIESMKSLADQISILLDVADQ